MKCRMLVVVCAVLSFSPLLHAEPVGLTDVDPLTLSIPDSEAPLPQAAADTLPADLKVTSGLFAQMAGPLDKSGDARLEVIVLLHEPAAPAGTKAGSETGATRVERMAALQQRLVRRAPAGFSARRGLSHLPIVFGEVRRADLLALAALPEVQAVEEVRLFQGDRSEGGALIKATQLRNELGGNGRGVGIAVVDSGIWADHPDFGGRVVAQLDATRTTGDGRIDQAGHGTAVAGILAGANGGMAPEATLWAMKALNSAGQGTSDWILTALNAIYAARHDHGGIRVVNMSLSDATSNAADCDLLSPAFAQAIDRLTAAGIAVFTSSGNSGYATGISHPACLSNAISVGALYDGDNGPALFSVCRDTSTAADQLTCYSNSGPPLDLLAPSHCARTTKAGGGYLECFGGTSAASPYAAGVAAQILSLRPATTPAELRSALMSTGRPIGEPWTGLVRNRIDAVAAYQRLTGGATAASCVPSATALCLVGGRFKVEATYETAAGATGQAQVVQLTDDSGYLWFFNAKNVEAVVKVLDACALGGKHWVFAGGLTDVRTTLQITDSRSGAVKTYTNPQGTAFLPIQDTAAFATCP